MSGFRVFTPIQALLVVGLTLRSVGAGSLRSTLLFGAIVLALAFFWSLTKYIVEKKKWNDGKASNGQTWSDSGRRSLVSKKYTAGDQSVWFTHFDPQVTKICLIR